LALRGECQFDLTIRFSHPTADDKIAGVLLGTVVGDTLGLPAEGMSRQRIQRRWRGEWRHRLFFSRGMMSDDTEHPPD
jgi:ADP-ribosylglycohydrolase